MTNDKGVSPQVSATVICGRIVVLLFALGGIGAVWGTKLARLVCDGADAVGVTAGGTYLLVSACLAVPGALILRHAGHAARR
jgi:hypothetical protein